MYLIVYSDSVAKQVCDNLTVSDHLAASQRLISIFRFRHDGFEKLVFDKTDSGNKVLWIPVPNARILSCADGRVHA